ncbi:MAG: SDR family oxidoreductase, partial [Vicinamibacteria bacterium]
CAALGKAFGADKVRGVVCDVRDESSVAASMACAAVEFGGLDILVSNAGIASASPIEETTLQAWQLNMDILATGSFLVGRDAFALLKRSVLPEDVAEAVYFLASPLADKSTGNILNVDAGNLTAFAR